MQQENAESFTIMKVSNQTLEKLSEAYTSALLAKFNDNLFWEKPWFNVQCVPINLRGTGYSGANLFLLSLMMSMKNYQSPVFLTYNQAQKLGAIINKGEKGYPVQRYITYYITPDKKFLSEEDFLKLTPQQQEECTRRAKLSSYTVFNLTQTNIQQVNPEAYSKIVSKYSQLPQNVVSGNSNKALNDCIEGQKWICPIHERQSNEAYYTPRDHYIVLPLREQFKEMAQFYSTALHEMAHSTKHPDAVGRSIKAAEGVDPYGHEELVAELSSGLTGLALGIEQKPQKNNIAYLKCWLENIKQDPQYIFNCLTDAKNISRFMCEKVGVDVKQSVAQEVDDISIPKELNQKCNKELKL